MLSIFLCIALLILFFKFIYKKEKKKEKKKWKNEENCRKILEEYFDKKFPSIWHKEIKNEEGNHSLQLDGYNKELKIAFEYNGEQHYIFPNKYNNINELWKFRRQQDNDKIKVERCKELGIKLIVIPYFENKNLKEFIIRKLKL